MPLSPLSPDAPDLPDAIPPGDADAFERAFRAYLDPLARYVCNYVSSWEVAEDLVHDVFYRLWIRLEEMEPIRELRTYLYTAARYRATDWLRRRALESRHRAALNADSSAAAAPDVERALAAGDLAAAVQRAIDELPRQQRAALLLRWKRQASHEAIAAELGIAVTTVAVHLRRAIEHLRRVLPEYLK